MAKWHEEEPSCKDSQGKWRDTGTQRWKDMTQKASDIRHAPHTLHRKGIRMAVQKTLNIETSNKNWDVQLGRNQEKIRRQVFYEGRNVGGFRCRIKWIPRIHTRLPQTRPKSRKPKFPKCRHWHQRVSTKHTVVCKSAIQLIWCFEFEASESAIIGVKSDKIVRWISEPMRRIMELNQSVEISHDGLINY